MLLFILWFIFFIQITDRLILDQKPVDGIVDKTKFVVRMYQYNLSGLSLPYDFYFTGIAPRIEPPSSHSNLQALPLQFHLLNQKCDQRWLV